MRTPRLLEYIRIMKSIAGKRHKGETICKILATSGKYNNLGKEREDGR